MHIPVLMWISISPMVTGILFTVLVVVLFFLFIFLVPSYYQSPVLLLHFSQTEIAANDKKISAFMGYNAKFHSSYNLLMEVVERIESLGYDVYIDSMTDIDEELRKSTTIQTFTVFPKGYNNHTYELVGLEVEGPKIQALYAGILLFIEKHNKISDEAKKR